MKLPRGHVEYVDTIDYLERMNSSYYGNPRFRIHFTSGHTAVTQSDAALSYGLENRENIGVPVTVRATAAGYVYDVRPVQS